MVYGDAEPVPIGGTVDGGGGYYDLTTDFSGWLGDVGRRIESCVESTGAAGVVFVAWVAQG